MKISKKVIAPVAVIAFALVSVPAAHAALTADSTLQQVISAGTASTYIADASGAQLTNPLVPMSGVNVSTAVQTSTGTFGSSAQRIYVDNPGAVTTSWSLALNATTPGTGVWTNGTNTYKYNGTTAAEGQLTINATAATYNVGAAGTSTGISKGTGGTFTGTNPITLGTGTVSGNTITNGYFTGFGLSQTIPGSTPAGTYTLPMTQTLTVN